MFTFTTSFSSEYIYGIHWWARGASSIMNNKTGWTLETVNTVDGAGGRNELYSRIQSIRSEGIFTPIVRINYSWGEGGSTIPPSPALYDQFANDCAEIAYTLYHNYQVRWIQIGNEMNLDCEYPPHGDYKGCPADEYIACFRKVYTAIKNRVPEVYVLVGPVGPYNNQGPLHSLSESGVYYDVYFDYIVKHIGSNCDGYAIHPYALHTEPEDNNLQLSIVKGIPNSWGFNCFKVYMKILQQYDYAKTKPVHATETNTFHGYGEHDKPAYSYVQGWMQESFRKIDDWNNNRGTSAGENPHGQKILSLCWFVYEIRSPWELFALQNDVGNLPTARADFSEVTRTTAYRHNFGSTPPPPPPPPPPPSNNNAVLVSHDIPSTMVKGSTARVHIKMKNTGSTTWSESTLHRLGAGATDTGHQHNNEFKWKNFASGGYYISETNQRCFISGSIAPNGEFTFEFDIEAPQTTGTKYFEARMVQDGVEWFGQVISVEVNVTDTPSPPPSQDTTPPARVNDLAARPGNNAGEVVLSWTAPGDDGYSGTAAQYDIRFYYREITDSNWNYATQLANVPQPQVAGTRQTWTVPSSTNLTPGATYYFALKARDDAGNWSPVSNSPSSCAGSGSSTPPVDNIPPTTPYLLTPQNNSVITSLPIIFKWTSSEEWQSPPVSYELQISNNEDFQLPTIITPIYNVVYTISSLPKGKYWWRVRARDSATPTPNSSNWSEVRSFTFTNSAGGVGERKKFPREKFVTKMMSLTFPLEVKKVIITDTTGNVVATLDKEVEDGSPLIWDGRGSDNRTLSSGIYIYKTIDGEGKVSYGTVVLVK